MGGGAEQVVAGEGRLGMHQRHHVLQLVAEAIGAAGLIKAGPAPEAGAQGLIHQPAVDQYVHGGIGRLHVDRPEGTVPIRPNLFERQAAGIGPAKPLDQVLHVRRVSSHPEAEAQFMFLCLWQVNHDLQGAAGVQPRPDFAGQARAFQRRWLCQAAVAADKFLPVAV